MEGIKLLGAAVSKSPEFQANHVQTIIDEAHPVLQAIAETHLQPASTTSPNQSLIHVQVFIPHKGDATTCGVTVPP